jgi:Zn ribbon nucleic-acid-binding protein
MPDIERIKVGRNDPCPCGKKRENGLPMKYKNCCLKNDKVPVRIKISRKDFIGSPYTECPKCKENTFGVSLATAIGNRNSFGKECTECGHKAGFKLPEVKKRIVYLDQFVLDNIVKSLDKKHPKNAQVLKDPFWIELFKKLEVATRSQLIVCPDSFFHREEAGPTGYFEAMQRIYEYFSGGATFDDHEEIVRKQICEHFESYLKGHPEIEPATEPEKIVHGELHEWHGRMHISINMKPKKEQVDESQKSKTKTYQSFLQVFDRWKTEKHKKFDDWYKEENGGFASGTILAIRKHYEKQAALPEKMMRGKQLDLNDVFPPPSLSLVQAMQYTARKNGLTDNSEIFAKIRAYLFSDNLDHIPVIRIGSLLYAALADQAAKGRTNPPSPGVVVDVNMISSLLPYCDAIFVDKENAALLGDGRVKGKLNCQTKIFSLRNKEEFLQYLDEVISSVTPEHLTHLKNYYGSDWDKPYMKILEDKHD